VALSFSNHVNKKEGTGSSSGRLVLSYLTFWCFICVFPSYEKKQTQCLSLFVGVGFMLFERSSLEGHADHFLRQK